MSHLNVFFSTDNQAFADGGRDELKRVLGQAIDQLDQGGVGGILRDSNGNRVGLWGFSGDDDQPVRFGDDENAAVVVVGSPVSGFRFVGPFPSHWEAEQFVESADWGDEDDRWVAEISPGL